jgi:hypothetical protein
MRAVVIVLRGRLRPHWKSWLALSVLVAVAGGFVLATKAASRRTATDMQLLNEASDPSAPDYPYGTRPVPAQPPHPGGQILRLRWARSLIALSRRSRRSFE